MNRTTFITMFFIAAVAFSAAAQTVTFSASEIAEGATWTDTSTYATETAITLNDSFRNLPPQQVSTSVSRTRKVTVTSAVGRDRITGATIEYTAVAINGVDVTSQFAGLRWLIDLSGNKVSGITLESGATPDEAMLAFVRNDATRFGQMREMNRTFGGETVVVGETLRARNPAELIDAEAGFNVDDFSMKLASVSGEDQKATFAVTLELSSAVKKGKGATAESESFDNSAMTMTLTGTLVADVDTSRIESITLAGPTSVSAVKATGGKTGKGSSQRAREKQMSGSGTASLTSTYVYP